MKHSHSRAMMMADGAPKALFLTPEQRAKVWERTPPRAMPLFQDKPLVEDAATAAFREQLEQERLQKSRAKIERMKNRFASKEIDYTKMRWNPRRSRFEPFQFTGTAPVDRTPTPIKSTTKQSSGVVQAQADRLGVGDWSRVTKDNAEAIAKLNGVWKDSYEKLRGTGRIVMTVCNVLKGIVKRGGEVKWM